MALQQFGTHVSLVSRLGSTVEPVSLSSIRKQTSAYLSHSWEKEDAMLVDDSQIDGGRPQIVNAFWESLSNEDRQRIPLMKGKSMIRPAQEFIGMQVCSITL